jgi:adenylate cyclase
MTALRHRWAQIAVTLLPVALALGHAAGFWRFQFVEALDHFLYDARLRAMMPRTLDPRIVIVDVDDLSLQELGQWPWRRDYLARLATEVIDRQQAKALGFDVLFAERDSTSRQHDAALAGAVANRPVALGFYFTQTERPRARGSLPPLVLGPDAFPAGRDYATRWNGFVGSLPELAEAAPRGGFLNVLLDDDQNGVVRSAPLIARYVGQTAQPGYYESLSLAVFRMATGARVLGPALAPGGFAADAPPMRFLSLATGTGNLRIPLDATASVFVPYRGPGGPDGGSFRHVPAADVIGGALAPGELKDKIVLVGSSAPGLEDLRSTPAGAAYPGVEVHANIISGLLDGRVPSVPDYAAGYELVTMLIAGLVLAFGLSLSSVAWAALIMALMIATVTGINTALFARAGLVLPLAATLVMIALAFVLNVSWGYLIEARASRRLARLFGTYVPPELVAQMRRNPKRYSMRAQSRLLTVMFCDMRGFTQIAEGMTPVALQDFLNDIFSRLTAVISAHRGTVDKYIGDCVMAFWGAPVEMPNHAELAVRAAIGMVEATREINEIHRQTGRPEIQIGIGLSSGVMSVGDMGSAIRRSYTVVGDAVNLASRIEGLGPHYGVEIVAAEATRALAPSFAWQELDRVRVQGKQHGVSVFTLADMDPETLDRWNGVIAAYRAQDWRQAQALLAPLRAADPGNALYRLYEQRLAAMASQPIKPEWDGATLFETK